MPKVTKREQLVQVRRDLAEAEYYFSADGDNWAKGHQALIRARATVAELTGDIDGARDARRVLDLYEREKNAPTISFYALGRSNANNGQG